jgi:hypothetical protein
MAMQRHLDRQLNRPLDRLLEEQLDKQLSYVGETGNGCQIFRETCGSYLISTQVSKASRRGIATLASAYAACQTLNLWIKPAGGDAGYAGPLAGDAPT